MGPLVEHQPMLLCFRCHSSYFDAARARNLVLHRGIV